MSTVTMLILIALVLRWVHHMESREAQEEWQIRQMIREARTPGARRQQYGTVGYLPRERRRSSWAWVRM